MALRAEESAAVVPAAVAAVVGTEDVVASEADLSSGAEEASSQGRRT